jgi:hypothetical protein
VSLFGDPREISVLVWYEIRQSCWRPTILPGSPLFGEDGLICVESGYVFEAEAEYGVDFFDLEAQVGWRGRVQEHEDVVEFAVAALRYFLFDAASAERYQSVRVYLQAEFFFDFAETVERFFACREMSGGGYVEVSRPDIFYGGAALNQEVWAFGS